MRRESPAAASGASARLVPVAPTLLRAVVRPVGAAATWLRGRPSRASDAVPSWADLLAFWSDRMPRRAGPRRSLRAVAGEIDAVARRAAVVGFDVFDTVLLRRVEPEWVKTATAHALAVRLRALSSGGGAPDVRRVRVRRSELEVEVAGERVARGEDDEVDFAELLRRWAGTWLPTGATLESVVAELRAYELDLERRAVFAAPGASDVLRHVHDDLGKRVIFASDMYLSEVEIRALLDGAGLGRWFDAGYASTDHGRRKATGRLFELIARREGIRPDQLAFVGDHPHSDAAVPARLGIATVRVDDPDERRARDRLRRLHALADRDRFWRAHLMVEAIERGAASVETPPDDAHRVLGRFLAPHLAAFALHVLERCRDLGVDRVYFLSREGLFLRRLCRVVSRSPAAPRMPQHHYLLVSRATTYLPSLDTLSLAQLARMWRQYPRQSLHGMLRNLGLPEQPFVAIAARSGLLDADEPIVDPAADGRLAAFLKSPDTQAAFAIERDRARALLRDHLRDRGFFDGGRVAFVDVGWKGSIQDSIRRAVADEPGRPEVHGLYFGLIHGGDADAPDSSKEGFMADWRRGRPEDIDFFRTTSIHEMVTTPGHGTVVGYERDERRGRVRALLLSHETERENRRRFFAPAQQEIVAWAKRFAHVHPLLPYSADDLRPGLLDALLRYVCYPDLEEATNFLSYSHVESFGVEQVTTFGMRTTAREVLTSTTPVDTLRRLRRDFRENCWREAVIRRSRVPLANVLFDAWWTFWNHR